MFIYVFEYEDVKNVVIFLKFWFFSQFLEKSHFLLYFKNVFFDENFSKLVNVLQ